MATSFTGLSEAQLDDKIIGAIQSILPMLSAFSTRLDATADGGLVLNNSYIVPVVGAVTVADKTPGTLVDASGNVTGVPVVANKFKGASFDAIEGRVSAKLLAAWWSEQIREAMHSVAATVVDDALGLLKGENYGTGQYSQIIEALADVDADTLQMIREYSSMKLKGKRAAFICAPSLASRLLTLGQVVYAYGIADRENLVRDGQLPDTLVGHRAMEYVDFPANGENLVGAVVAQSAIAVVAGAPSQILESGMGDITYRRIVEEPESGLSVQYTESANAGGKITAECAIMYGVKKAQDAAVLIATA